MQTTTSFARVPGLAGQSPAFLREFARVVDRLQIDGDAIAALLSHESRFDPTAHNPTGDASGLMQWIPSTARFLFNLSPEQVRALSALEQLPLVEKTFAPWRGKLAARDVPMVGFGGAFIGKPDSFVAYRKGQKGYDWNAALDTSGDGELTLGEVRDHVLAVLGRVKNEPRIPVPPEDAPAPSSGGGGVSPGRAGGLGLVFLVVVGAVLAALKGAR